MRLYVIYHSILSNLAILVVSMLPILLCFLSIYPHAVTLYTERKKKEAKRMARELKERMGATQPTPPMQPDIPPLPLPQNITLPLPPMEALGEIDNNEVEVPTPPVGNSCASISVGKPIKFGFSKMKKSKK